MSAMIDEPEYADADSIGDVAGDQSRRGQQIDGLQTGNPAVDEVLASLDGLAGRPVDEHVAVFERAHEQLRSALDGPRDA